MRKCREPGQKAEHTVVFPFVLLSGSGEDGVQRVRMKRRLCKAGNSALTSTVVWPQPGAPVPP